MSGGEAPTLSLRLEQTESSRLVWAFVISLAIHLLLSGGYYAGKKYDIWANLHWPSWLRPVQTLVQYFKPKEKPPEQPKEEESVPLMYVDVSSAQATPEPPKDAIY